MAIKGLNDLQCNGQSVLVRVDHNVPLKDGKIQDDSRIQASLPTLTYLLDRGCGLTIMSHLGRPKGPDPKLSLMPVATHLSKLLSREVKLIELDAQPATQGQVQLLENLRFYDGETKNDPSFAAALAKLGRVYVNDAFGAVHRAHASIDGVTHHFQHKAAGFLLEKEIHFLKNALEQPDRPFWAILGGAKVADKLNLIHNLLPKVDGIMIGGAMSYTFLKAMGFQMGTSRVEDDLLDEATSIIQKCKDSQTQLLLPKDHVVADQFAEDAAAKITLTEDIEDGMMGLDIGPESIHAYCSAIRDAKTVVWNGPMGVFEWESFSTGTISVAEAVANMSGLSIIGGGDSVSAANQAGVAHKISHISTGGGASLELLSGEQLPGLLALESSS